MSNHYTYIAVTVAEAGKYYSYVVKVALCDNLVCKLRIKDIVSANICSSKKQASELVERWNDSYKANGKYMFQEPDF